jgi:hypothetical protein
MTLKRIALILTCALCLLGAGCAKSNQTQEHAEERVLAFAQAVNYDYETPETIYTYLTQDFHDAMTEDEFTEAFSKERSYPYLVPLFINYRSIEMDDDMLGGTAHFSQAARLPGMTYDVPFVYENGDYYMIAFDNFPDGSYLDKFEDIPYSLDSYYDMDQID